MDLQKDYFVKTFKYENIIEIILRDKTKNIFI